MKTKLSFLALLISLGMALTFALAACSSSGGNSEGDSSSSGGGNTTPLSSAVSDAQVVFTVGDEDTYVNLNSDKVELLGIFQAGSLDPIKTLNFLPSGWVKYNGNVVNSPISISGSDGAYINLNNKDTEVDLKNSALNGCGEKTVQVIACLEPDNGRTRCTSHNYTFTRPQDYCATSSSSVARSSSSEATWKFGSKEGPISAGKNSEKEIPGFSAKFTLSEKTVNDFDITFISISGGNIRWTDVNYNADDDKSGFTNTYPEPNKSYPNSIFKNMKEAKPSMDMENLNEYYIITASSGSDKYLIRVEPRDGPSGSPGEWDKKVYYWKVLEGPSL